MQTRTRRVLRFTLGMVAAWTVAAFISIELVRPHAAESVIRNAAGIVPSDAWSWRLARALVAGVSAGLLASVLELRALPRHARRLGAGAMLLIRTVVYAGVGVFAVLSTVRFMARRELGVPIVNILTSAAFRSFLASPAFVQLMLALVVASFLINGTIQVSRLLGPGTAAQILLGRYLRPIEEERTFLFIDLVDSTGIAERLGPVAFADLKNDFFYDIAEPVLETRGQIVQYVGDEVMITWPRRGTLGASSAVRCFYLLRDRVARGAERYRRAYGSVPDFKGGLHGGIVVVSQLGDVKREIAFSGDAVNTAARIQSLCRELAVDFLASAETLEGVRLGEVRGRALGEHGLRGRTASIELVALSRSPGVASRASADGSAFDVT